MPDMLTPLYQRARPHWSRLVQFLAGLPGSPPVPQIEIGDTGSIPFRCDDHALLRSERPSLHQVLERSGLLAARYSKGGEYFIADASLYVSQSPEDVLKRVQQRLIDAMSALRQSEAPANYSTWIAELAVLQLARNDICTLMWQSVRSRDANESARSLDAALRWNTERMLRLFPAERPTPASAAIHAPALAISADAASSARLPRAIRAGDRPATAWVSLQVLMEALLSERPRHVAVVSNGFGGLCLGWWVMAGLDALGIASTPRLVEVSARRGITNDHWCAAPDQDSDLTILCDDSVSSGASYALMRERFGGARSLPFIPMLDEGALPRLTSEQRSIVMAAGMFASGRAPWSPSGRPKPAKIETLTDLLQTLAASSDETLRQVAERNANFVKAFNET